MVNLRLIALFFFLTSHVLGQIQVDTLLQHQNVDFNYKALIVPSVLLGYGIIGLESHTLKIINSETNSEFTEHIDEKLTIDDFSQYMPIAAVYGLNAVGISGKNNFKDRTIIIGTAYILMGASVNILKKTGNVQRPDGTSNNSFPSGHTATAFMGAEFLYQEYKDKSVWYGITGYIVATGTGFFRLYNRRHWLTDVAAGAGIGILSTKIAYWVHPWMKKKVFRSDKKVGGLLLPFYNGQQAGVAFSMSY